MNPLLWAFLIFTALALPPALAYMLVPPKKKPGPWKRLQQKRAVNLEVKRKQIEAVTRQRCDCTHFRCFHKDDGNGACVAEISIERSYATVICKCLRYSGPVPVSELIRLPSLPAD